MLIRALIYVLLFYLGLALYAHLFANSLAFYPPKSSYQDTPEIIKITTQNGAVISAVYLANKKAAYTVLVSHGNAEDIGQMMPFLQGLHEQGVAVLAYDYEGYGTSSGKPTEAHVYDDINAAYEYLITQLKIPASQIILYGRSLGAAVAIDLAARKPVAGVIVESPFLSAFRSVTQIPLIPFDKFNNLAKITRIKSPILIIHGKQDNTILFWQGEKLYRAAHQPKTFLAIDTAGHNDVALKGGDDYWSAIKQFVQQLR